MERFSRHLEDIAPNAEDEAVSRASEDFAVAAQTFSSFVARTLRKASTTSGSNCLPVPFSISSKAFQGGSPFL